jgi:hypothetical protein
LGRTKSFQHAGISPSSGACRGNQLRVSIGAPTGEGKRTQRRAKVGGSSRGAIRGSAQSGISPSGGVQEALILRARMPRSHVGAPFATKRQSWFWPQMMQVVSGGL